MASGPRTYPDGDVDQQTSCMDRAWEVIDRWTAVVLLSFSVVASAVVSPDAWQDHLLALGLALVAGAYVVFGHVLAPETRRQQPTYALLFLVGLLGLAALLMSLNPMFFVFAVAGFFHAAALRPFPLVFIGTGATGLLILWFTWGGIPRDPEELVVFLSILAIQTLLIGFGVTGSERMSELSEQRRRAVTELQATLAENEALQAQLVERARVAGVTEERQRMAREIHDTLAQGLTGVITQLEAAGLGEGDPPDRRRHLEHAKSLARTSLAEARRSVQALSPGALEGGRLSDALDELTREWSRLHGVPVELVITEGEVTLAADLEVVLLRAAQESLANVGKHAGAARVGVTLSLLDDQVTLDVRDDGCGFDPAEAPRGGSFGLLAMRQRLEPLGGTVTVESSPGEGTAISASVPIGPPPGRPREAAARSTERQEGSWVDDAVEETVDV